MNNMNKVLDEFESLPFDPTYQVDLKECSSDLEIRNERIAAHIAQKYNLIYRQGEEISTKTPVLSNELLAAHKEISQWMSVSDIDWFDKPANEYFFIFNSYE